MLSRGLARASGGSTRSASSTSSSPRRRTTRSQRARGRSAVECVRGIEDKLPVLREEVERRGFSLAETAYLGNDVNDAECLAAVGLPVVPADAWAEVVPLAKLVLARAGGHGCVRELCDAIWSAKRAAEAA